MQEHSRQRRIRDIVKTHTLINRFDEYPIKLVEWKRELD